MADDTNREDNQAQQNSDATPDVESIADTVGAGAGATNRNPTNTSDSSGIPADDERAGDVRRRLHEEGFDPNVA